jgi:hypothetical protein
MPVYACPNCHGILGQTGACSKCLAEGRTSPAPPPRLRRLVALAGRGWPRSWAENFGIKVDADVGWPVAFEDTNEIVAVAATSKFADMIRDSWNHIVDLERVKDQPLTSVTILLNGEKKHISVEDVLLSYEDVVWMVTGRLPPEVIFSIVYTGAAGHKTEGILAPTGSPITVKEGTRITAVVTSGA